MEIFQGLRLVDPGNLVLANGNATLVVVTQTVPTTVVFTISQANLDSVRRARTKVSSGNSGMAIRRADRLNRAALASGRNKVMDPLSWRYAFSPSKNSWA